MKDEPEGSTPSIGQLKSQAHEKMLGALSADHLTFFSRLIGQLAISNNPTFAAATRQLDDVLTAEEKQTIEAIGALLDKQISQFYAAMRRRVERDSPPHHHHVWSDARAPMTGENPSIILLTSALEELTNGVNRVRLSHPPMV